MEKNTKRGVTMIIVGAALNFTAFAVGVNAGGIILMFIAITLVGYGAGTVMDSPCELSKD